MRAVAAAALIGIVTTVSSGIGVGGVAANHASGQIATFVTTLNGVLDEREAAVRAGDVDRWMATVDPRASAERLAAERRAFEGWASVPLGRFSLHIDDEDLVDLAAGDPLALADRYQAGEVSIPVVERRHQLEGFDDRDAVDYLFWTFVQRDGRWFVAGDDDLRHLGLDSATTLWELGPVVTRATDHFLFVSRPAQAGRAAALAEIAEEAHEILSDRWDRPWSGRLPVILPSSIPELEEILQSTFDLSSFVAFVLYDAVRDDGYRTTAPRIYIQDTNLSRHSRSFQLDTLVHELVHAAAAAASGPRVDVWLHEGLAEWVTEGRPAASGAPSGSDGRLPEAWEFRIGGSTAINTAYQEATSMVTHLAGIDPEAPVELFFRLGARQLTPGTDRQNASVVLRRLVGMTIDELEADWS